MTQPTPARTTEPSTVSVGFLDREATELQVALNAQMSSYASGGALMVDEAWHIVGSKTRFDFNPGLAQVDAALHPRADAFDRAWVLAEVHRLAAPPVYFHSTGVLR